MHTPRKLYTRWLIFVALLFALPLYAQLTTTKHIIDNSASGGFWLHVVDVDGNGDPDILVSTLNSGIKLYKNNNGSFSKINIATNFPDSWSIHAGDLNGDEEIDVVACSGGSEDWTGPSEVAWWENDGSENFTKHTVDDISSHPHAVAVGDLDDDGDNDIAIAAWQDDQIVWLKNNGTGDFTRLVLDDSFASGHSLHVADLNLDGKTDLIAGGGSKTAWYRNNGGSFAKNPIASGGGYSVAAADVNSDGSPDILRGRRDTYDVDWLQGPGFGIRLIQPAWSEAWSIAGGDLDADGDTDIFAAAFAKNGGSVENRYSYWLNNGSQSFTEFVLESGVTRAKAVGIADFDDDGDLDLAGINRSGTLAWYEVTGSNGELSSITLTAPDGGESLTPGALFDIIWTSTGSIANVKLEYSINGGSTYDIIIDTTPNDGAHTWTLPAVNSSAMLVRVSDAADGVPIDVSNSVFTIASPASLTLTAPNGGEIWVSGSGQTITWTSSGVIASVKLEYSINNGLTYNNIIASTPNDGSHGWTIPNESTTQALVRVSDAADGNPLDVSNAAFSINSGVSLTLTSPNGGENLAGGSNHNITWTSTGSVANVKLEFSLNNGLNYTEIIASTPNDGSHSWAVPGENTTQALIRIADAADNDPLDVSNAVFSITTPANLTLTAPNGGENWVAGSNQNITWTSTGVIANVKLEYSTNAGSTWNEIIASSPNDGAHTWTLPNITSTQTLVRVSDAADGLPSDVSNNVFNIVIEGFTLTSPSGGQILTGATQHQITWTSTGSIPNVKLEYSIDNGVQYTEIVASTANDGSFNWTVPVVNANFVFVRVADAADGLPSDVNDAPFSITLPTESFTLSAPNGGEVWSGGSNQSIVWSSTGVFAGVKIEYSTNGGISWNEIAASAPNNGLFAWTVPSVNSNNALVRVSDAADGNPADVSNSAFTIDTQGLTLTSPNGGENWGNGDSEAITWNATGNISAVKLEYSTDSGSSWNTIANSAPNTGSYNWIVQSGNTATALVRISDAADGTPTDGSDAVFSITISTLTLTQPNGGGSWFGGSNQTITWTGTGAIENVKIEYSLNNGASWAEIISATPNDGSHPWIVPNSPTTQALARISDASDGAPADVSDATFSIANSTLTLTSPNGGEIWSGESVKKITWSWSGSIGSVKLEYSINSGASWNLIVGSTGNNGNYNWTLPDVATSSAMMRITNASGESPSDMSDGAFSIIGSSLTINSPNGGENWDGNSDQIIQWSATGVFPFVKIEYSLNAGGSWTTLVESTTNIGSYSWKVTNLGSEQALVRISDASDGAPSDMSNAVFKITQVIVSVEDNPGALPTEFGLSQNYPNPFNPDTKIDFAVPAAAMVRLAIYNMKGELMRLLLDEHFAPGVYTSTWNGLDKNGASVPSGIYVYRIQIGDWQTSKKLVLMK